MKTTNFLLQTKNILKSNRKKISDINWIGLKDGTRVCDWKEFKTLADFECPTFGLQYVDSRLVIVGDYWWLERDNNNWAYREIPTAINVLGWLETVRYCW